MVQGADGAAVDPGVVAATAELPYETGTTELEDGAEVTPAE